ncbi:MAG: cellulase family glycosylhydrolase, partial [Armatimonadetes bacterium]|nr:cellulase family glycosylhydrolase [Armatimonadota bacterium]
MITDGAGRSPVLVCFLIVLVQLVGTPGKAQDKPASPRPGDLVFSTDFDTPQERAAWSQADFAEWVEGYQGTTSLRVSVSPANPRDAAMIRMPLDLTPYRGCRLYFECMAKAENVSRPSKSWLGVKFMLHYLSATEGPFWKNQDNVYGTFDWRKLAFSAPIASDATGGEIDLGLQDSTGTVWFDAIRVTVFKGPPPSRPRPPANPGPVFKGHNLPRLRGVMSPNVFRDEDLRVLGLEWNANLIRWQITRNWGQANTDRDLEEYDQWFDSRLDELDKALEACRRYGIKVVVDMHSPPGGRYEDSELAIFHEPLYQDHFVASVSYTHL